MSESLCQSYHQSLTLAPYLLIHHHVLLDKTQLVGGSWWWDPWIGSQPNLSRVCSTNERFVWDPMKRSHESRSTHSLGFDFILWCFCEYMSSKIVYFYLKYCGLFLYSKSSRSSITASKNVPYHCSMTSQNTPIVMSQ